MVITPEQLSSFHEWCAKFEIKNPGEEVAFGEGQAENIICLKEASYSLKYFFFSLDDPSFAAWPEVAGSGVFTYTS